MKTTTYKEIKFKSGDVIPVGTEGEVLPYHPIGGKPHPFKCLVLYSGKRYLCNYELVIEPPSESEIEDIMFDSTCPSVNGVEVEPDGFDPDGFPSWLQALGMV